MSQTEVIPVPSPHKLGWGLAALVVAGNMIGSGVYLAPVSLAAVGSSSLIGWLICGLGAMTLALVFAGLGRVRPDADGLSDFTGGALGRFVGYQTAIAYWAVCLTGNVAVAIAGTGYLAYLIPALKGPAWAALSNLAMIGLTTAAYASGARTAARAGAATLVIGLMPIVLAIVAGALAFSPGVFTASWNPSGQPLTTGLPASLVVIFWSFLGLESAAALSNLTRDPVRDVGRAGVAGVALALVVYVLACVAVFGVIPATTLAHSTSPFADLAQRVLGASIGGLVAVCAVIKAIGTIAGWTMLGGETARGAAQAGFLPRWFGPDATGRRRLANPLVNGAIMAALTVVTIQPTLAKQFGLLIGACSVMCMVLYGLCAVSLFRLTLSRRWKGVAVAGLVFAIAAVVAAAPGYILPTATLLVVTTIAWFAGVRRRTTIDPARAAP